MSERKVVWDTMCVSAQSLLFYLVFPHLTPEAKESLA